MEGDWLVALDQQAGRGRQGRTWLSVPGNFTGTTIVQLRSGDPAAQTLSLAAGLALIEAVDLAAPDQPLLLKWPNDLMLDGKKLAGILLERSGDRIAVGFGVNLAGAPQLPDGEGASLGGNLQPETFAPLLAGSFARLLDLWRQSPPAMLAQAWLARAHPIGTRLTVHSSADETASGSFDGIESDGALRLRRNDGSLEVIRAGDILLR
jgi:BirA family biotin operon repressor/biotin-[acetyl-CoA-carboxylase] ligase